ncbi:MAG TPA: ABC transporter permease [Vicinamibacterales bacterium]|jgi:predicted permease|nr:ABC transporter permease [Vicinamibacterales bacterium]
MAALRRVLFRLLNAIRPLRAEPDLDRELAAHLRLLEDDFQRRGLPPEEARLAATRVFGGVAHAKDLHRDARSFVWLDDARWDVRHGARLLGRHPLFSLTAVASLAIGIGANTTVFTVANALLLRPPAGVVQPAQLVDIGTSRNGVGFGPSSFPNYIDIRSRTTTLDGVYASNLFPQPLSLGTGGTNSSAERFFGTFVSVNYFTVLGAHPCIGRLLDARDSDQPGAAPVAVLSYGFWTRHFANDPTVVGRTIELNGHPFTIVGVTSEGFHGTTVRAGDLWLPLNMVPTVTSQPAAAGTDRAAVWLLVGGRLKPGLTLAQAGAEIDTIGRTLEREYPSENRGTGLRLQASSPVPGNVAIIAAFLALLLGVVLLVLAITCANVASVLLARAAARRTEIAVRLAMGAGRMRLIRQLLAETTLLFLLGGALGLPLARALTSVLVAQLPNLPFPVDVSLALEGRAVLFTAGVACLAALLAGLTPALQASRTDVVSALKDDTRTPERLRLRHAFVAAQVGLSVVLITVAGLFVRALERAGSTDPGFDSHGVELASLNLSQAGYTDASGRQFARDLVDRVRALPDVKRASLALSLPGGFEVQRRALTVPGATPPNGQRFFGVDWNVVEPGYFATLGLPIVAGRDFNANDREGSEPVAIAGEEAAQEFWPGRDPLGQSIVQPTIGPHGQTTSTRVLRVIGVARDIRTSSLVDGLSQSLVYVPLQQQYTPNVTIVARSRSGRRLADELRKLVEAMNPNLPIVAAQTLEDSLALGLIPQRLVASVAGSLGFVGLVIAALGLYGVMAYAVTVRTREIGIRIALGARRANVIGLILRQGMLLTIVGAIAGLLLSAAVSHLLSAFLFGVPPMDPVTFSGAAALFIGVGLVACYLPTRQATRIDAMDALRYE